MWNYVKRYLHFAVLAALFMMCEVMVDLIQPEMMSQIVDVGVLGIGNNGVGDLNLIWNLGIKMILLVVFGGFCGSMNNVFVHIASQNIGNEIRKDCFSNLMRFSFSQVDQFSTGSLVTRITNDVTQVQNLVAQFIRGMIRTTMLTFGSIYFLFRLHARFGIIVSCVFPVVLGCIIFCLKKANPLFLKLQAQLDRINSIMQEDVSGIRIIKACVREIYEKVRFGKANDQLIKTQLQVLMIFAFMNPVMNAVMYMAVALILLVGSFDVSSGFTTPGTIMAAITYTTQLLHGILMLVMLFQNISRGFASWDRVKEILYSQPEQKDGSSRGETAEHGSIEFRDVSFAYPGSNHIVLKDINLQIHPGETVAIMGATGCGKSSLINLIPRFYDVTEGTVLVNGMDVREYPQKLLREKVAVAQQKSELFSVSIKENIAWGQPSASDSAIEQAAKIAQAHSFIQSTPNAYETLVAERGMSLSGGQKQRLSIARTVLKPADILIFDDSTSALDLKTEADLYQALENFRPDATKIIVAQRVASARRADRIVVLENGTISAVGSHDELLDRCKTYQDIYYSQLGEEAQDHERE